MIKVGSVVRGNWSQISYRVDHAWSPLGESYWCINGKAVDNPLSSGSFSYLGERVGNEIPINAPDRPADKLYVVSEPKTPKVRLPVGQLELILK